MPAPIIGVTGGMTLMRGSAALFGFSGVLQRDLNQAKFKVAAMILRDAKKFAPVTTGALRRSGRIEEHGSEVWIVFGGKGTQVDYAPFVEFGRAPGTAPPAQEMESWANKRTGDATNAFVLARAIGMRGTRPKPFLRPAMLKHRQALPKLAKVNFTRSWNRVASGFR